MLLVEEPGSSLAERWLEEDGEVCTWSWTRVELVSAIERRAREGSLGSAQRRRLLRDVDELLNGANEVIAVEAVRAQALTVLARYPLRAADAAQLGAALLLAEGTPSSLGFVCLDERLADAAARERFVVHTWPE